MLFASRRLFTAAVTCPLKLSMMIMAGVLLPVDSRTLLMYGIMIFSMYWIMVVSLDQYFGECVISHSGGNSNRGWHRAVFPW